MWPNAKPLFINARNEKAPVVGHRVELVINCSNLKILSKNVWPTVFPATLAVRKETCVCVTYRKRHQDKDTFRTAVDPASIRFADTTRNTRQINDVRSKLKSSKFFLSPPRV